MKNPTIYNSLVLLFIFIGKVFFAQNDSLHDLLKTLTNDSAKTDVLIELAKRSEGDTFLKYMNNALTLSQTIKYRKGIAAAHAGLARHFYFKEDFSVSLVHCMSAYRTAKEIGDNKTMAYACLYLGFNNFKAQPKISLGYYLKCVEYCKLANYKKLEAYGYSAIGNLYESWYDGKNALKYYDLSLKIRQKIGEPGELVSSLIETARAYNRLEQFDKSNELIQEGLKMAESNRGNEQNLVYLYEMAGYEYFDRVKDHKKALGYFLKARKIAVENNLIGKNNINNLKPIAETYLKLGDHKNSAEYFKLYNDLMEANQRKIDLENAEAQRVLKSELEKEKTNGLNSEIALQKMNIQKQETMRYIFIAGILFLLILLFYIFRNNRLKEKLNTELESMVKKRTAELDISNEKLKLSEHQLTETNKELESFIYRTSHDLKSPLASSRGLINLALRSKSSLETFKYLGMIQTSLEKLDSILVTLYEISIIRKGAVQLKKYDVETAINNLIKSFAGSTNFDRIQFTVKNQLASEFVSDEILIQTILRNMIENTIKYSQLGIESPMVDIRLIEQNGHYVISIADNGIGIPEEHQEKIFEVFYRANSGTKGSGLGLYIVKNAIDKLGGKVELVRSKPHEGTVFNLYFPKNRTLTTT